MDRHMQPSIVGPEVWNHMWFDRKCQLHGCQTLAHKHKMDQIKEVLASDDTDFYMITTINRIVNNG